MAKVRILAMLVLFASAAMVEAFRLSSLSALANGDIWWHLSSGLWILQHHAFPRSGLFSQAETQTWIASSWGYDLRLALAYKLLGLRAIPVLFMGFKAVLAVLTFLLAGGLRGRFWAAVALSAIAQYILGGIQPGPGYFSILFFAVELLLLLEFLQNGRPRLLLWLPLLFLVWANVHVQFVYGLAVLLLFLACRRSGTSQLTRPLAVSDAAKIAGASLVATLVTPYWYRPYEVFFATTFSSANQYLPEFHAPGFRQPQDYLLMLLGMAAFLTLGLRRSRDLFQIMLLVGCVGLSFYSQRDAWLVVLAALAVIGEALAIPGTGQGPAVESRKFWREAGISAVAAVAILLLAVALRISPSRSTLLAKVGQSYPVAACDYIRDQRLGQPLFNAYEWGGFLTWYLPEYPVAIDGRGELYGEDVLTEYAKVMNAEVRYTEYPALAQARTILLPKKAIMAGALSSVPSFKVAYSDDVAVVLNRKDASE